NFFFPNKDPGFPATIEFQRPETLAAYKCLMTISNDRSSMQSQLAQCRIFKARGLHMADNLDLDARFDAFLNNPNHFRVGYFGVVDQQLFPSPAEKCRQLFSRIRRAYDEIRMPQRILTPRAICFEQFDGFLQQRGVGGADSETTAVGHIKV